MQAGELIIKPSLTVRPRGRLLESLRKREGDYRNCTLTQKDVEIEIGIPEGRLYRVENDYRSPLDFLAKLSSFYKVPLREIIEDGSYDECLALTRSLVTAFNFRPEDLTDGK